MTGVLVAPPSAAEGLASDPLKDRLFWRLFSRLSVFTILFEDTDVEARFFGLDESSSVLAVAAAGCGIASMLASNPERIDAVDANAHHLALSALKVAAAQHLGSHEELYALFGHGRHPDPDAVIGRLSPALPGWAQAYWAKRHGLFRAGLYRHGLFARSLGVSRRLMGTDEAWMRGIMDLPEAGRIAAMEASARKLVGHPLAGAAMRSPLLLLANGINFRQRDRNLASAGAPDMAAVAIEHARRVARSDMAANWIAWHTMVGHFNHAHPEARPPYLREANHQRSFGARTHTAYHRKSFLDVMREAPACHWSHYGFSDALDWMAEATQRAVFAEVLRTARPGATVILRTVEPTCLVSRLGLADRLRRLDAASDEATRVERSGLYQRVDLYRVRP